MSDQSERGRTKYNKDWENPSLHPEIAEWIKPVIQCNLGNPLDDIHYFQYKVCNSGKISLSSMGVGSAKKHDWFIR